MNPCLEQDLSQTNTTNSECNIVFCLDRNTQSVAIKTLDSDLSIADIYGIATFCVLVLNDMTGETPTIILDRIGGVIRQFEKNNKPEESL